MIFQPDEISEKRFVIRWRGYDTREVETFLRAVAVDFRRLIDKTATGGQPVPAEDQLAEVRDELSRLSSRVDLAIAGLEATGAAGADPTGPVAQRELHLVRGGSGGN
jgi:DivIVA domain-containing protein